LLFATPACIEGEQRGPQFHRRIEPRFYVAERAVNGYPRRPRQLVQDLGTLRTIIGAQNRRRRQARTVSRSTLYGLAVPTSLSARS
jgi:hypothetical protein